MTRLCAGVTLAALVLCMAVPANGAERLDRRETNFQVGAIVPGLGNRFRAGHMFPVAVELSVLATPVSGKITITTESGAESIPTYSTSFDLSPGAPYRYYLYPYCQNLSDTYTLTITDASGRELRHEQLAMKSHETGTYLVATIGQEDVAGLGPTQPDEQRVGLQAVPVQLDFMPGKLCGWDPADAIIWSHPDPSTLAATQEKALVDWVSGGGRLVIALGDTWQPATKTFIKDLLPGVVTGADVTRELDKLSAFGADAFDQGAEMSIAAMANPEGEVLVWAGSKPLVARKRFGFGDVIFLAFDPTKRPFARWRGSTAFWDNLFGCKRPAKSDQQNAQANFNYGRYGPSGVGDALTTSLGDFPEVKPISFGFVVVFLIVYVVLIGPVDYLVLRRLKHLEWTWFTFPAVAVLATGIAFWTISSTRTAAIYINQLSIGDWSADGQAERFHNVAVLLSPTNKRYDATFRNAGGELFLMEGRDPYGARGGFNIGADTFALDDSAEDGPVARKLLVQVWSTRTFCGQSRLRRATQAPFLASLHDAGGVLEGTVTCDALTTIGEVKVIHKTGVYNIGTAGGKIGPSETVEIQRSSRVRFDVFYDQSRRPILERSDAQGAHPDRQVAESCALFATVGLDGRFFPGTYYGGQTPGDNQQNAYDLPAEWSLRSAIESGQAVVIGAVSKCPSQLDIGPGNTTRYERTLYRVCVQVK